MKESTRMVAVPAYLYRLGQLLRFARRPFKRLIRRQRLAQQTAFANQLLPLLAQREGVGVPGETLAIVSAIVTRSDVAILKLRRQQAGDTVLLKLPISDDALASANKHQHVLAQLHRVPGLDAFLPLIPMPLAEGTYRGRRYFVESLLPGVAASELRSQRWAVQSLIEAALPAIGKLHQATGQPQLIDEAQFGTLVLEHLQLLRRFAPMWPEPARHARAIDGLEALLRRELLGRTTTLSWIHGDYWLGNVLIDSTTGMVGGIVDWDRAVPDSLPLHDLVHVVLYSRKVSRGTQLGEEVVRLLAADAHDADRMLITKLLADYELAQPGALRAAVLLYWLRLVAVNLARYPRFRTDQRWLARNVLLVLAQDYL